MLQYILYSYHLYFSNFEFANVNIVMFFSLIKDSNLFCRSWLFLTLTIQQSQFMHKKSLTHLCIKLMFFLMVPGAGLEPAWHGHTPLKRTRLPVSPRPQRLCNYIITIIIFQVLIYKTIIKISNWAILNSKYEELSCFYWILFNLILI